MPLMRPISACCPPSHDEKWMLKLCGVNFLRLAYPLRDTTMQLVRPRMATEPGSDHAADLAALSGAV